MALALSVAILVSSFHHFTCGWMADQAPTGVMVVAAVSDVPVRGDDDGCMPGHCHCVCHVTAELRIVPVVNPVEFAGTNYQQSSIHTLHSVAGYGPFEPPRA